MLKDSSSSTQLLQNVWSGFLVAAFPLRLSCTCACSPSLACSPGSRAGTTPSPTMPGTCSPVPSHPLRHGSSRYRRFLWSTSCPILSLSSTTPQPRTPSRGWSSLPLWITGRRSSEQRPAFSKKHLWNILIPLSCPSPPPIPSSQPVEPHRMKYRKLSSRPGGCRAGRGWSPSPGTGTTPTRRGSVPSARSSSRLWAPWSTFSWAVAAQPWWRPGSLWPPSSTPTWSPAPTSFPFSKHSGVLKNPRLCSSFLTARWFQKSSGSPRSLKIRSWVTFFTSQEVTVSRFLWQEDDCWKWHRWLCRTEYCYQLAVYSTVCQTQTRPTQEYLLHCKLYIISLLNHKWLLGRMK